MVYALMFPPPRQVAVLLAAHLVHPDDPRAGELGEPPVDVEAATPDTGQLPLDAGERIVVRKHRCAQERRRRAEPALVVRLSDQAHEQESRPDRA